MRRDIITVITAAHSRGKTKHCAGTAIRGRLQQWPIIEKNTTKPDKSCFKLTKAVLAFSVHSVCVACLQPGLSVEHQPPAVGTSEAKPVKNLSGFSRAPCEWWQLLGQNRDILFTCCKWENTN